MFQLPKGNRTLGVVSVLIACISLALSQTNTIASNNGPSVTSRASSFDSETSPAPQATTILAGFVEAEAKVREALNQHTFKRDVVLQTIGPSGEVTGEYIRNSQFVFDDRGKRIERVLFHPKSTIREMRITREDIQDLAGGQLLGIDIAEATKYRLSYAGTEVVDSLQLHAVDISPTVQPDPNHMSERFFVGRVWLDPKTFQIVKIKGIVEPQGKQRFPMFETWREPIKTPLAFPARTEADDVLHFRNSDVHYRIKVRYYDYKLFGSKVSVTELDEHVSETTAVPPNPGTLSESTKSFRETNKSSKPTETPRKTDIVTSKQPLVVVIAPATKTSTCATNRSAPPVGPYHWPADAEVKVYFLQSMFTPEQRGALVEAMATWSAVDQENGSGVKFSDAGETTSRMSCRGCLTVGRKDVYKRDKHHYAFFYPMEEEEGRLLVSAWIDLDFGITSVKALKGFMVHELAHGLGLWDCTTCRKKSTIMNGFPGINKDNGLVLPSMCDVATVKDVYQEERQLAAAKAPGVQRPEASRIGLNLALPQSDKTNLSDKDGARPSVGTTETGSSSSKRSHTNVYSFPMNSLSKSSISLFDLRKSLAGDAVALSSTVKPTQAAPVSGTFTLAPLGLDKTPFTPLHLQGPFVYRRWLPERGQTSNPK